MFLQIYEQLNNQWGIKTVVGCVGSLLQPPELLGVGLLPLSERRLLSTAAGLLLSLPSWQDALVCPSLLFIKK